MKMLNSKNNSNKYKSKITKSLIVTYDDSNLQLLDLTYFKTIGINLEKHYQMLGKIILEEFVKNKKFNFIVWIPKKYAK